uniref:glutathione transferase n=1 Tax=Daucus carota subsp. sativus TaxID=79200 RepID=A0A161ZJY6_DAUCS
MVSSGVQVVGTTYSTYVNRVQIALNLKSVDFEFIKENLFSKSDLLLKSNPVNKKVPVLIHDGKCICESLVIVQYIDDTWTRNGYSLLPCDPYDRAVARFWAAYFDEKWIPMWREISTAEGEAKEAAVARAVEGLVLLDEAFVQISKGKAYFGGDEIGFLDIVIGTMVNWIKAREVMANVKLLDETKIPGLVRWVDKFISNDVVKNILPSTDEAVEVMNYYRARADGEASNTQSFVILAEVKYLAKCGNLNHLFMKF